ncbi:MAG: hypothetical protein L0Z62_43285 [Gemmataceae bacterium]|nr:hypothetical protein [Gemmataceae bacterium]
MAKRKTRIDTPRPDEQIAHVEPANPFRELEQFAWQKVYEEEQQRDGPSNSRPRPMNEAASHVRQRELQLKRLCDAAMTAGRGTGFSIPEVVERIERLRQACMQVLMWDLANLRPAPQQQVPAGVYLCEQLNRLAPAIEAIHQLAVCFDGQIDRLRLVGDGDQGGTGQTEGATSRRRRGRKPDTDPKEDGRIWDAWKSHGFKNLADLASNLHKTRLEVKRAIDRHRHRLKKDRRQSKA